MKKKGIAAVLACILALSLSSCSVKKNSGEDAGTSSAAQSESALESSAPEEDPQAAEVRSAVENALEAYREMDMEKLSSFVEGIDQLGVGTVSEDTRKTAQLLTEHLSYTLQDVVIDGEKATVKAQVTNGDFSNVLGEFVIYALMEGVTDLGNMDAQVKQKLMERLDSLLTKAGENTVTQNVEFQLQKKDGSWIIQLDEESADALLGGLLTSMRAAADQLNIQLPGAAQ